MIRNRNKLFERNVFERNVCNTTCVLHNLCIIEIAKLHTLIINNVVRTSSKNRISIFSIDEKLIHDF